MSYQNWLKTFWSTKFTSYDWKTKPQHTLVYTEMNKSIIIFSDINIGSRDAFQFQEVEVISQRTIFGETW